MSYRHPRYHPSSNSDPDPDVSTGLWFFAFTLCLPVFLMLLVTVAKRIDYNMANTAVPVAAVIALLIINPKIK